MAARSVDSEYKSRAIEPRKSHIAGAFVVLSAGAARTHRGGLVRESGRGPRTGHMYVGVLRGLGRVNNLLIELNQGLGAW